MTHHISENTDSLGTWSCPVSRYDALDAHFLRSAKDVPLLANNTSINGTDEDVYALQILLQLLEVVDQVSGANFNSGGLQRPNNRLRHGRGSNEDRNALRTPVGQYRAVP